MYAIRSYYVKNKIPVIPYYGGILESKPEKNRFIEAIAYEGTSLDPHEVFFNKADGKKYLLAGIRKVPISANEQLRSINEKLGWNSIIEIGRPNNDICGVKIEKSLFGITTIGGTNPFANIHSRNIPVEMKTLHKPIDYSELTYYEDVITSYSIHYTKLYDYFCISKNVVIFRVARVAVRVYNIINIF